MDRKELKEYVYSLMCGYDSEYQDRFQVIKKIGVATERVDSYGRSLEGIFRIGFGTYNAMMEKYTPVYVFTGMIYERIDYQALNDVVDRWLEHMGVAASDRMPKYMHFYMGRIMNVIRDRELRSRLSVMCFENCVVDFNTMKVYPHSAEFDCMKVYPFKYDRKEIFNCPLWKRFLGEGMMGIDNGDGVLPEKSKRRILQMFLGACLVDRKNISFEYFLILQGAGANGKSVIYRVLSDLFGGEEILNIKMSNFARGGDENLRAAFAMEGKRLMYCTESNRGDFADMSTIKAVSSGEPIACRGIGGNIGTLQRPPVLMCNSNYRWKPSDFLNREDPYDESMQRRAIILNFDRSIPVEKRDTTLADKMKKEQAGIFAWIVKGLVELKKNGWRMPEYLNGKIDLRLERIRSTVTGEDGKKVDGSITEYMKYKKCSKEPFEGCIAIERLSSDIYKNYKRFCERNGVIGVSSRKFGLDMATLGYKKEKSSEKGYSMVYTLYCSDEHIAESFMRHVPNIAEEAKVGMFEGWEYSDDDFVNMYDDESDNE